MLNTSVISPGHLSTGGSTCLLSLQFFINEGAVPCLLPPSFPLLLLGCSQTFCHLSWITSVVKSSFCLEKVVSEGACELLSVLIIGVLLWPESELRFSLIWPVRNLRMEIPSPFPLLVNTGSREWSPGIEIFYSLLVAFYCKEITITQHIGKAVPRWADPWTCIGQARRCRTDPPHPPFLAEQDTGPS